MGKKKAKGSLGMQWFTTGVSTTLVLILLGIVSFFILFAQRLSDSVKENLTVTVLLDGEASRSDIHEFRTALKGERYVYALDYVSKEQALKEQVKAMGSDPSEFLGANPFTASLCQFRQFGMDHRKAEKESFGGGCDVSKRAGRHGE